MTDIVDDYINWLFSAEGQREHQRFAERERIRWHAGRFRRAADRHDRRIPFETRVAVLERANEHCEYCGRFIASVCAGLELHHLTYENAYGDELPSDLMALCRECHQQTHGLAK
jgi:5-methylcytosine-specific restriction endonuclease McrA